MHSWPDLHFSIEEQIRTTPYYSWTTRCSRYKLVSAFKWQPKHYREGKLDKEIYLLYFLKVNFCFLPGLSENWAQQPTTTKSKLPIKHVECKIWIAITLEFTEVRIVVYSDLNRFSVNWLYVRSFRTFYTCIVFTSYVFIFRVLYHHLMMSVSRNFAYTQLQSVLSISLFAYVKERKFTLSQLTKHPTYYVWYKMYGSIYRTFVAVLWFVLFLFYGDHVKFIITSVFVFWFLFLPSGNSSKTYLK